MLCSNRISDAAQLQKVTEAHAPCAAAAAKAQQELTLLRSHVQQLTQDRAQAANNIRIAEKEVGLMHVLPTSHRLLWTHARIILLEQRVSHTKSVSDAGGPHPSSQRGECSFHQFQCFPRSSLLPCICMQPKSAMQRISLCYLRSFLCMQQMFRYLNYVRSRLGSHIAELQQTPALLHLLKDLHKWCAHESRGRALTTPMQAPQPSKTPGHTPAPKGFASRTPIASRSRLGLFGA